MTLTRLTSSNRITQESPPRAWRCCAEGDG